MARMAIVCIFRRSGTVMSEKGMEVLSLKRVYLYRKLIILNEKNKSSLTPNNPAPIPGCHAPVKAVAHSVVVI